MARKKFSLKELQNEFADKSDKKDSSGNTTSKWLPFWKMKVGQSMVVRILPDKDETNPKIFALPTHSHAMMIDGNRETVSCPRDHGKECPLCDKSQELYAADDKVGGKRFWRTQKHVFQCIVVDAEDESLIGTLKYIGAGSQLFNVVKAAIGDEEMEVPFFDFDEGTDLVIRATANGEFNNYSTSSFKRKSRAVTDEEYELWESDGVELKTLRHAESPEIDIENMLNTAPSSDDDDDDAVEDTDE